MDRRDITACISIRASTNENPFSIGALTEAGVTEESVAKMLVMTHKGWVAETDGQVVGFGMGNRSNGEFWVVAVLPKYVGRGIGKRLTELVQEWLFSVGCSELWLWTSPDRSTRAYGLYRKLGWEDCGVQQGERIMKLRKHKEGKQVADDVNACPSRAEMNRYLNSCQYIDWATPSVREKALDLANGMSSDKEIAKICFEFVRDEIKHSWDHRLNPVTLKASEVLAHGTGYCYSKSHLLAALLRANGIPAALCYQRLTFEDDQPPFCLHGLNAIHLREYGWYRVDARGNREDVSAEFDPPHEKLAFEIGNEGEKDITGLFSEPLDEVIKLLSSYSDFKAVAANLPDY